MVCHMDLYQDPSVIVVIHSFSFIHGALRSGHPGQREADYLPPQRILDASHNPKRPSGLRQLVQISPWSLRY